MSRSDRFLGCLMGLAVGDALGYPIEGWTQEQIQARYGPVRDYVEPPTEPPEKWRLPGLHSDDTQQALVVADTLIEAGRADPDVLCQKFLDLAEGPPHLILGAHRGAGRNFRYTIQALREGASWNHGSRHTAGVGATMRVAPVGLAFGLDDAAVRSNAALQALVTHNDPRAVAASCVVAHSIGRLAWFHPEPLHPEPFLEEEIHFLRRSEDWLLEAHGRHLARDSRPVLHHMSEALAGIAGQTSRPPE
ncbi:MAG: ADP-ribosylglycohydrolase family protein, partial [Candidatus Eisenbacteria bacterium]|nr:ADP-ribosylglycohydrolase family protein [Candidatus Eisenbacteria bacterium]